MPNLHPYYRPRLTRPNAIRFIQGAYDRILAAGFQEPDGRLDLGPHAPRVKLAFGQIMPRLGDAQGRHFTLIGPVEVEADP